MADHVVASFADLFYELRGPLQKNYRKLYPLMANIERRTPRSLMTGNQVRVPIVLNALQGGGAPGESGTINVPQLLNTTRATVATTDYVQPFSLSPDLDENSMDNAAVEAMALLTEEARNALAEIVNDGFNAQGSLLATVASAAGSPGLTLTLVAQSAGVNGTNFDRLYPGRVVDVLTRSSGADPGAGKRRKIASFNESAVTVTFDTNQTASDGGSGNITYSANEGIYVTGNYTTAGNNSIASLHDAAATSGTFQGINKATVAGWQGIDGRAGTTTLAALVDELLDGAVRRGRRNGGFVWDFGMGDPAAIDLWKQSKYAQVRYDPQPATIDGGFSGTVYDGADRAIPLIKEDRFENGNLILVPTDDIKIYGKSGGPEFVADDGGIARRFSRTLPKEVWLRDKLQLVFLRCNRIVRLANLTRAA